MGDKIAIVRNYNCFDSLHSPISEAETIILGGLLAEGSLTSSFGFSNTDKELLTLFKTCVEEKWQDGYMRC